MEMKTIHIGDLGEIKTGSTPSKKNPDNYGDYALWIKPTDINPDEKYTRVVEEMFSEKAANDCRSRLIPANSICVPCIGTVGTKLTMTPCDCFVNQSINAVIPNDEYDNDYVYYLLLNFLPNLKSINKGTASGREYIAKSAFENIEIQVHSNIEVQRTIGKILSAYDEMIDTCKQQIALLEEAAQRLYREWFVDMCFPGHETTPIGENGLPEGWDYISLDKIAEYINGFAFKPKHWQEIGLPIIKIKELNGGISSDTPRYTGNGIPQKYNVKSGDIIFSWSATLTSKIWDGESGWLNQHLFKVIPNEGYSREFVFQSILKTLAEFKAMANGSTMQHIQRGKLSEVKILTPPKGIMQLYAKYSEPFRQQILSLASQIRHLREVFNTLLPRLISGQIEIKA